MPPLTLLIKPASGNCNMRCKYCFYADEAENREVASYGIMSLQTLEHLVQRAMEYATRECTFTFQGGEPTFAGLDFYRELVKLVEKYNTKHLKIYYAIQTNGYLINQEWAKFLAEHQFLVGLSLDGNKDQHDQWRLDAQGKGTFTKVMHAVQLFNQYKVEYNILTVITAQVAKNIAGIYGFYKRNHFLFQQYIACLDPIGVERGKEPFSLTPQLYGKFLCTLFDLWYQDVKRGNRISIRFFDNLIVLLRGYAPESCGMLGHCVFQNVIEADGSVYPCDFYALDQYRLGNINTSNFAEIHAAREESSFLTDSIYVSPECKTCRWAPICRGGCRRDREPMVGGKLSLNYFCDAYKQFYEYAYPRLLEISRMNF